MTEGLKEVKTLLPEKEVIPAPAGTPAPTVILALSDTPTSPSFRRMPVVIPAPTVIPAHAGIQ